MDKSFGHSLRQELTERDVIPFIGVYDVFSASIAAKYYDAYRFHQKRAHRRSGRFITELEFHLKFRNWLLYPLSQVQGQRVVSLAVLMTVWQVANAAGFLWEAVNEVFKRNKSR